MEPSSPFNNNNQKTYKLMNDGRYSTFIDMKKMKENGLICDEKALIHQRQL